ncbi:MAG: hypothetical protein ACE5IE_02675 [Dehalococcoidia bacterium]
MRFRFTEEQERLREEIDDYFRREIGAELLEWLERQREKDASPADSPEFTHKLAEKG